MEKIKAFAAVGAVTVWDVLMWKFLSRSLSRSLSVWQLLRYFLYVKIQFCIQLFEHLFDQRVLHFSLCVFQVSFRHGSVPADRL